MKTTKWLGLLSLAVLSSSALYARSASAQNYFPILNPETGKLQTVPHNDELNIKFLIVELKTISVSVVDDQGRPIPGANLTLTPLSYLYPYPASFDPFNSISDVHGRATFSGMLLGDYQLTATSSQHESQTIDASGDPVTITLKSKLPQDSILNEY